jgi:chromosome segregation ATPase
MAKGEHVPTSSPKLTELLSTRAKAANALTRCEKALASLEQYLGSLTVQHLEVSRLDNVLEHYEATGARLDVKKAELTAELLRLDTEISLERTRIAVPHEDSKLRMQATIGVFAQAEGDVEIALIYGTVCYSFYGHC